MIASCKSYLDTSLKQPFVCTTLLTKLVFHGSLPFNLFQRIINHVRGPIFSSLKLHNAYLADLFFWGSTFAYAFIMVLSGAIFGLLLTFLISQVKKHLTLFDWNNI